MHHSQRVPVNDLFFRIATENAADLIAVTSGEFSAFGGREVGLPARDDGTGGIPDLQYIPAFVKNLSVQGCIISYFFSFVIDDARSSAAKIKDRFFFISDLLVFDYPYYTIK